MSFVRGALGYVGLLLLLLGSAHLGALLAARWLGAGDFRWFAPRPAAVARWRRFAVRLSGIALPLVACVALAWAGLFGGGTSVPTATIRVLEGPAKRAGMLDGDRVVAIDGTPIRDWEQLRSRVKQGGDDKRIEIERSGARQLLLVTRSAGAIGVLPTYRTEAIGAGEALQKAVSMPFAAFGAMLRGTFGIVPDGVQVTGPVGIVRSSEQQSTADFVPFLAILGITLWPWVAGLHLFDAGTLALFGKTHAKALSQPERAVRLCRLHQALAIALAGSLTMFLLSGLLQIPLVSAVVLPFLILAAPAVFSLYLLVWIMARERFSRSSGWVLPVLVAATLIPCISQLTAITLLLWSRRELEREGFDVGWFSATPREALA